MYSSPVVISPLRAGVGMVGGPHSATVNDPVAERVVGQTKNTASTYQVTRPRGTLAWRCVSNVVEPIRVGEAPSTPAKTLYLIAPRTLVQQKSTSVLLRLAPFGGERRVGATASQKLWVVKMAQDEEASGQP